MIDHDPTLDPFLRELVDAGEITEAEAGELAVGLVTPEAPAPALRDRLMKSVAGPGRLHRFADEVARILEVAAGEAKKMLTALDDAATFQPGPIPILSINHVDGGPALANAITGFIKMPAGTMFPEHTHLGEETVMVIQGRYRDVDGTEYGPGDVAVKPAGSTHSFDVLEGMDLIYLAVVHDGLEIFGEVFGPDDPRL